MIDESGVGTGCRQIYPSVGVTSVLSRTMTRVWLELVVKLPISGLKDYRVDTLVRTPKSVYSLALGNASKCLGWRGRILILI